jgi:hypothetical protein
MPTALETIRAQYGNNFTMRDQMSVLSDIAQGGGLNLSRSDDFIDSLEPVDLALSDAWRNLEAAAEYNRTDGVSFGAHHPDSPSFGSN